MIGLLSGHLAVKSLVFLPLELKARVWFYELDIKPFGVTLCIDKQGCALCFMTSLWKVVVGKTFGTITGDDGWWS